MHCVRPIEKCVLVIFSAEIHHIEPKRSTSPRGNALVGALLDDVEEEVPVRISGDIINMHQLIGKALAEPFSNALNYAF